MSGCFEDDGDDEPVDNQSQEKVIYYYNVEIQTNGTKNYTIYLPIPIKSYFNPKPTKLMNEIRLIEGNADFKIINTEFGHALQLISSGDFEIEAHNEFENPTREIETDYIFGKLSMPIDDKTVSPNLIYFNSSSQDHVILQMNTYYRREIRTNKHYGGNNYEWGIQNYTLKNGWQELDMLIDFIEWD
jgi:hypothetical protein